MRSEFTIVEHPRQRKGLAGAMWTTACALALSTCMYTQAVSAPVQVTVDNGRSLEYGAGISVGKGPDCFIVVPKHVVEVALTITITDSKRRSAQAHPFADAPDGIDATLLKVEADHSLDCPEDWDDGTQGSSVVQEAQFLIARKVKEGGVQQQRLFLNSESSNEITLTPYDSTKTNTLSEGDSGSSVYAMNALVGMILNVETETGTATAIKQTQLHSLFGSMVLEQGQQTVYVQPVYFRNQENRYATVGLLDLIDTRTTLRLVDLPAEVKTANLAATLYGKSATFPDDVDYVVSTSIIDYRSRREDNPNYKASAATESNFGQQILNSVTNKGVRYFNVSNVDVEVTIHFPKEGEQLRSIVRREYTTPLTNKIDTRQLVNDLQARAAVEAVHATMVDVGMPVIEEQKEQKQNSLLNLFNKR